MSYLEIGRQLLWMWIYCKAKNRTPAIAADVTDVSGMRMTWLPFGIARADVGKSGMSKGKAKLGPGVAFLAIGTIAIIAAMLVLLSFFPK